MKIFALLTSLALGLCHPCPMQAADDLAQEFASPPPACRPWVYWYFMDGNMTRDGLTADLEAMHEAGIGGAIFLEVDVGLARGPVRFMSPEWRKLFVHAVREAERLGIEIALGSGPGWCGTGGPWVKAEQSMQHLVSSETRVIGPGKLKGVLWQPAPRLPFFGMASLTPELEAAWRAYYRDVAVLAFPTPKSKRIVDAIDEKALYKRAPYSSAPNVRSSLARAAFARDSAPDECIAEDSVVDLTGRMGANGQLEWDVPPGDWTILRFGRASTGQATRPAPLPGLGFEVSKFDTAALNDHFDHFVGTLLRELGPRKARRGGLTTLHFDSWEMSSQNWSRGFRKEFRKRRGYDPLPFLPAYTGRFVKSPEITERFLWDVRQTAQELVCENHTDRLRQLAHKHGLKFSLEPYDMNPTADLTMGAAADIPMCEFWWLGFDTAYSVREAASIAHTGARPIVAAESFTSSPGEDWRAFPAAIKSLGDWAFASGVNRLAFHRYQHQPWLDRWPGMRMGRYGVHWERTQTWWPMVGAYHTYLSRCQFLLRQGQAVADILFLAPEGAPHVFRAPPSATLHHPPDHREYNFDGCAPETLMARATVKNGRISFPGGSSYGVLVLPEVETMTPTLLSKIRKLARAGALIVGPPPTAAPGLSGYPRCDRKVQKLAGSMWGAGASAPKPLVRWSPEFASSLPPPKPPTNPLAGAQWIWADEDHPKVTAPLAQRWFTRALELPANQPLESAVVYLSGDNEFLLTVNGTDVGKGKDFTHSSRFDITALVHAGTNALEVRVTNTGEQPNPAGLIATVEVHLANGASLRWETDASWGVASAQGRAATPARELGPLGCEPWGEVIPAVSTQDISVRYADYEALARLLQQAGISPDFSSDGPIRYTHRTAGLSEIYFLANREDHRVDATCSFRVADRQPELWHPVDGQCRELRTYQTSGTLTRLRLQFAPLESYFIVFRKPARAASASDADFPPLQAVQELAGAWDVAFDPRWGGPGKVSFECLQDWVERPETGVKSYSGRATYRKSFEFVSGKMPIASGKYFLDLGTVKNLARVRLNGRDLGVVWCAPWQVEITDALRSGANELEVDVANLWVNRLIADAGLPERERLTWTTYNPYKTNSPPAASGLLGPVVLRRAARLPP